jgi:hypothetical protein
MDSQTALPKRDQFSICSSGENRKQEHDSTELRRDKKTKRFLVIGHLATKKVRRFWQLANPFVCWPQKWFVRAAAKGCDDRQPD